MGSFQQLVRRVEEELSAANQRRQVQDDPQRRSIVEFQRRQEHYVTIADRVLHFIIRPRMNKIAE